MATTSLTLGDHWEGFIRHEIEAGRYKTTSEVVRAGLRELEQRAKNFEALRLHIAKGAEQADQGLFAEGFDIERIIKAAQRSDTPK